MRIHLYLYYVLTLSIIILTTILPLVKPSENSIPDQRDAEKSQADHASKRHQELHKTSRLQGKHQLMINPASPHDSFDHHILPSHITCTAKRHTRLSRQYVSN